MRRSTLHLWTARLVATIGQIRDFYVTLAPDEQRRADAFHFDSDRNSFIVGRGLLRVLLGWYVNRSPEDVRLKYGSKGKPALDCGKLNIHFNVTHSAGRVLYAVSEDCELGTDLELVREIAEAESIAKQFFTRSECAALFSVSCDKRAQAFFNCWTRKEAFLKATGDGLSMPLSSFEVSVVPGERAAFLSMEGESISKWNLVHIEPEGGYIGAVAMRSIPCQLFTQGFANAEEFLHYLKKETLVSIQDQVSVGGLK